MGLTRSLAEATAAIEVIARGGITLDPLARDACDICPGTFQRRHAVRHYAGMRHRRRRIAQLMRTAPPSRSALAVEAGTGRLVPGAIRFVRRLLRR